MQNDIYNSNEHISRIFSSHYLYDKIFQRENNIDMNVLRQYQNRLFSKKIRDE